MGPKEPVAVEMKASPFVSAVARLRHITGFVTVYGEDIDPRTAVFARLWHVRRVAGVARLLARRSPNIDTQRMMRLVWLHDLNRWPFAHNTEVGTFNQSTNTPEYLATLDCALAGTRDEGELRAIQDKCTSGLSVEAETVLMADSLAGLVEDSLLVICGLNVRPDIVPRTLKTLIGFAPTEEPWFSRCRDLTFLLHRRRDRQAIRRFQVDFRSLFFDQVRQSLAVMAASLRDVNVASTVELVRSVKRDFVRPIVFPINNDLVCHGSWLRSTPLPWYLDRYDARDLVMLTERQFVDRTLRAPGCPFRAEDFIPDLDAVARRQPDLAFAG